MDIKATLDYPAVLPGLPKTLHAVFQFKADRVLDLKREPVAFAVVIDRSTSMRGDRISQAKSACEMILEKLGPDDLFSVIAFCESAEVVFPLQKIADVNDVILRIQKIFVSRGTNLVEGWNLGRYELHKAPETLRRRLLILTDGEVSVGVSDPASIKALVSGGHTTDRIRTSSLGFGLHYNEALLSELASASGGNFYDADTPDKLTPIFREEFRDLTTIVAQNLALNLTPGKCSGAVDSLGEYPAVLEEDQIVYALGDLCSDEEKALVFRIEVDAIEMESTALEYEAVWQQITDGVRERFSKSGKVTLKVCVTPCDVTLNADTLQWISVQLAGRALNLAIGLAQRKQFDEARDTLKQAIETLTAYSHESTKDALAVLNEFLVHGEKEEGFTAENFKQARYTAALFSRPSTGKAFTTKIVNMPSFTRKLEF